MITTDRDMESFTWMANYDRINSPVQGQDIVLQRSILCAMSSFTPHTRSHPGGVASTCIESSKLIFGLSS